MRSSCILALLSAGALYGVATMSHAEAPVRLLDVAAEVEPPGDAALSSQPWSPPIPHKTLELDSKGRWGVRLDMEQPNGRDVQMKDVQAGAYVNFGPRIRVGGSVGLGDRFDNPQRLTPQDTAPRVHLETAFKF